jgi:hypothetical protein
MPCSAMAAARCQRPIDRDYNDAKVNMKTSTKQAKDFRPTIRKIVLALALVSVMGGMSMSPALSKDDDDRRGHADKGWHKGEWRGDRDEWRDVRPVYRPVYVEPYYYSRPVYVPPPVYYPPQQSPGINLFFPLEIRIR